MTTGRKRPLGALIGIGLAALALAAVRARRRRTDLPRRPNPPPSGVREPRRPRQPSGAGSIAADPQQL